LFTNVKFCGFERQICLFIFLISSHWSPKWEVAIYVLSFEEIFLYGVDIMLVIYITVTNINISVLIHLCMNTALSQSAFRISKCFIIINLFYIILFVLFTCLHITPKQYCVCDRIVTLVGRAAEVLDFSYLPLYSRSYLFRQNLWNQGIEWYRIVLVYIWLPKNIVYAIE
jgi:hypothetical protein